MNTERFAPSVTVAAIIERDGRFLLVEEHTPEGLRLNNPAGHLEAGESPLQAVCRETLEETMRVFTPTAFVGLYLSRFQRPAADQDVTYLRLAYCGTVGEEQPDLQLDEGIVQTLWLLPEEIEAQSSRHRSPLVWRCIQDYLQGRTYALEAVQADATLWAPEIKR